MPDLTDADLEAMEKRCEKELEGPWPHVIYPAHARSDVPALIAALREARAERDEAEKRYVEQLERADAAVGDRDHRVAALQAENRLLREWLNKATTKLCQLNIAWTWPSPDIARLTAAEAERVRRMERVVEAVAQTEIDGLSYAHGVTAYVIDEEIVMLARELSGEGESK